eukprot:scaffold59206_cov53-Attheya_sp.AAC.4
MAVAIIKAANASKKTQTRSSPISKVISCMDESFLLNIASLWVCSYTNYDIVASYLLVVCCACSSRPSSL